MPSSVKPIPKSLFGVTHTFPASSVSLQVDGVTVRSFYGRKAKSPSRKRKDRTKPTLVRKNADWNF